ncbi:DUF2066 domain-containing protein [Glaciecola siphonariae]|uniref:DUF2066 domain-containing protein n=1 Tax=Glaciecola siphonariae TaxID=521012 RepID=A0ABV9LV39_9ALTE
MPHFKYLIVFLALVCCTTADASSVSDIAVGRVIIENQSSETQKRAGQAALRQVFVKLSGSEETLNNQIIRRALNNYEQYLIASSYIQRDEALLFEARFNQEKLTNLLKTSGLPVWANLRPSATLWLASQTPSRDLLWLNQNTAFAFNNNLQQQAFERGVNIVLPLGDLTDSMSVSAFDVWTQNTNKLKLQTTRYNTPFTISASLQPLSDAAREQYQEEAQFMAQQAALEALLNSPTELESESSSGSQVSNSGQNVNDAPVLPSPQDQYQLDWIISGPEQLHIGKTFLSDNNTVAQTLVRLYADLLASQYASDASMKGEKASGTLVMANILSLIDYNQALALINSMPQIDNVSLNSIEGNTASFSVSLLGSANDLVNLLTLDKRVKVNNQDISRANSEFISLTWGQ